MEEVEVLEDLREVEIPEQGPLLNFNGEILSLDLIKKKKVTKVTVYHPTLPIEIKERGLAGALGKKHLIYGEKKSIIKDEEGVIIKFNPESEYITLHFGDKKSYQKFNDFDTKRIFKGGSFYSDYPYRVSFPIENLKEIS